MVYIEVCSWSTFVASSISLAHAKAIEGFVDDEEMILLKLILHCLKALIDGHASKEIDSDSFARDCSGPVTMETALVSAEWSL